MMIASSSNTNILKTIKKKHEILSNSRCSEVQMKNIFSTKPVNFWVHFSCYVVENRRTVRTCIFYSVPYIKKLKSRCRELTFFYCVLFYYWLIFTCIWELKKIELNKKKSLLCIRETLIKKKINILNTQK